MKCKKFKEKIILNLYEELSEKEKSELENHIKKCPECSKDLDYTKKVFKVLDESKEETPDANWEKCWGKVDQGVHEKPRKEKTFFHSPRWVYAAGALLLVFFLGALFGKLWFFPDKTSTLQPAISQSFIEHSLKEHFANLKPMLVDYANYTTPNKGEDIIIMDKEFARNLLIQNILLKSIVAKTNPSLLQFLEDVDIVLKEISNLKKEDRQTPSLIKELIHQREILFKIEIFQAKTI